VLRKLEKGILFSLFSCSWIWPSSAWFSLHGLVARAAQFPPTSPLQPKSPQAAHSLRSRPTQQHHPHCAVLFPARVTDQLAPRVSDALFFFLVRDRAGFSAATDSNSSGATPRFAVPPKIPRP